MIKFRPIRPEDKKLYQKYMPDGVTRGCEFSFANLCIWGNQNIAELDGGLVLFADFDGHYVYPYPIGIKNNTDIIDAIIADAKSRGISCRISGVTEEEKLFLESAYPEKFEFKTNMGSYDYIYSIDDLADLKGRKYQSKRNHINRFKSSGISYSVDPITEERLPEVKKMFDAWRKSKLEVDPNVDFEMEKIALELMIESYAEFSAEGLMLICSGEVVAFTIGTRMSSDTFDVHFEKALPTADGAYAVINSEFAKYIREKYPEVKYLNREEDMGFEGLRRAKESYHPCGRVIKYRAKYKG